MCSKKHYVKHYVKQYEPTQSEPTQMFLLTLLIIGIFLLPGLYILYMLWLTSPPHLYVVCYVLSFLFGFIGLILIEILISNYNEMYQLNPQSKVVRK